MQGQWIGLIALPADSLPTLDWNAAAVLAATFVGTAAAVFFGYKAKRTDPSPASDVILPSVGISDMRWGPELVAEVKGINARLDHIQACLREWREEDNHRRDLDEVAREAYERGRRASERDGRKQGG